ncbi:MAG TPA: hypothetical protein VNN72_12425 [Polyangiaceae bacterium]|nr:hypothetical protein [Polyangiaceae bacterium]
MTERSGGGRPAVCYKHVERRVMRCGRLVGVHELWRRRGSGYELVLITPCENTLRLLVGRNHLVLSELGR